MLIAVLSVVIGLIALVWSADRFVDGASNVSRHYGMSPLLIGMLIIGFGTSAPEMAVSVFAALEGNSGIALGNAYGSNITNIALILGITALMKPITVHSQVLRKELPILSLVTLITIFLIFDLSLSRFDAFVLLTVFAALMFWTIKEGMTKPKDSLALEVEQELSDRKISIKASYIKLFGGLILLIVSSRALVWGAVEIAKSFGVSEIIIGLTIVAVGTSLPELASSVVAARKGEPDIALGNVLGSNLFNTLAVVGISGVIHPLSFGKEILYRDVLTMTILTLSLFIFCYGFRGQGRINRFEAGLLLTSYIAYTIYLLLF